METMTPQQLQDRAIALLKTVFDPEIPVDIWELGLVYELRIDKENNVVVIMTLTSPSCPAAQTLPKEVETKLKALDGINSVAVQIVWNPPWTKDLMSEVARLELGMY